MKNTRNTTQERRRVIITLDDTRRVEEPINGVHVDQAVAEMILLGHAFASAVGKAFFSRDKIVLVRRRSERSYEAEDFLKRFARVGFRRVNPVALPA